MDAAGDRLLGCILALAAFELELAHVPGKVATVELAGLVVKCGVCTLSPHETRRSLEQVFVAGCLPWQVPPLGSLLRDLVPVCCLISGQLIHNLCY